MARADGARRAADRSAGATTSSQRSDDRLRLRARRPARLDDRSSPCSRPDLGCSRCSQGPRADHDRPRRDERGTDRWPAASRRCRSAARSPSWKTDGDEPAAWSRGRRAGSAARSPSGSSTTARRCSPSTSSPTADGPGTPFAADLTTRAGNRDAVAAALERFGRLDAVDPERRLPARRAGRGVPGGPLGRDDRAAAHEPVPARHAPPGRRCASPATGASSRSPPCTGSSPRRSRPPTCRPSTACSGSSRRSRWRAPTTASRATAVCPGYVRTPLVENQIADQAAGARRSARSACSRRSSSPRTRSSG